MIKSCFNLAIVNLLAITSSCVELDLVECGIDNEELVSAGNVTIDTYPWLGILYYIYYGDVGETRSVTTVVLIHKEFVVANAADIEPMPKHNFREKSRVLLGQKWPELGRRVRNYVIHPEYGETYNTLALVQLREPVRNVKIKPACLAPEKLRNPVFYVIKFKDDYNDLQKEVLPVAHIPAELCKEFYVKANLYMRHHRPPHVACAVSLDDEMPCVWDAGAALVVRDVWGRWQLLGVGVRGPGCGAPARFLDLGSYGPWIVDSLDRFQRVTISKITHQKYVLRSGGGEEGSGSGSTSHAYQKFGACDPEEKKNCIFRELIKLKTDTMEYQYLTYNMTIRSNIEYTCLTMELINASASSEMRVQHLCPRENFGAPCYYHRGTIFTISVIIMFADECLFEMYAWGFEKSMKLIDIQEWKWEEGTYYEDFYPARHDYRGQAYMTDYGYEPIDKKMWVPNYDLWTTTTSTPETQETTTAKPPPPMTAAARTTRKPTTTMTSSKKRWSTKTPRQGK